VAKTKEERLRAVHEEAIYNFDRAQSATEEEREAALEDRRFCFIAGAQWEGSNLSKQFEGKPQYEVNKVYLSVRKIINEYRANRITVDFNPKDGSEDDKLTDACQGLFRADERDSVANEAYDNAFQEAVSGGYGALRLTTVYEDEEDDENEQQRIMIEPIYDADTSVFFDLDAKRQDKSDANYCYVITSMTPDAYEDEFGEEPDSSVGKQTEETEYDWMTVDVVYIAEYYKIEKVNETVRIYQNISGEEERYTDSDFEDDEELEEKLEAVGTREIRQKKVKKKKVHKYILSGSKVIEDCGIIPGKYLPIVPAYGERCFIDNVERCSGQVRRSKDMQRIKNMQISKLAELSALSATEKPIFSGEQVAGHELRWANDNVKNYPFLTLNLLKDKDGNVMPTGALGYTKPPMIPPSMAALLQLTETDMQQILGNQQEADKMMSGVSGKAVEQMQTRIDGNAFIYMSNFAIAIRKVGEVWLSMAKEIYVEPGRNMKTIGKRDDIGTVELMKPTYLDDMELVLENDISKAVFDVNVDVGASSSSKRESTIRSLTNMMQMNSDPETAQVLQSMAMMNMEGEGVSEAKEYFRKKLVQLGVLPPNEEEQKAMEAQAQQEDPQAEALKAMAAEADSNAIKNKVSVLKTMSDIKVNESKILETESDIESQKIDDIVKLTEAGIKA
jgi:hypothetical protein